MQAIAPYIGHQAVAPPAQPRSRLLERLSAIWQAMCAACSALWNWINSCIQDDAAPDFQNIGAPAPANLLFRRPAHQIPHRIAPPQDLALNHLGIDQDLDQSDFLRPLIHLTPPELPPNTPADLYKQLIPIATALFANDPDKEASIGRPANNIQDARGIYRWVERIQNKTPFSMVPTAQAEREKFYQDLTSYIHALVLHMQRADVSEESKKTILSVLTIASEGCGTRWMEDVVSLFTLHCAGQEALSLTDRAVQQVQLFRVQAMQSAIGDTMGNEPYLNAENVHLQNAFRWNINQVILVPGGATASYENPFLNINPSPDYYQKYFFKHYNGKKIVEHFVHLVNGTWQTVVRNGQIKIKRTGVKFDRESVTDWFNKNIPLSYLPLAPPDERARAFLSHCIDHETGDFRKEAIGYFLEKCKLLQNQERRFLRQIQMRGLFPQKEAPAQEAPPSAEQLRLQQKRQEMMQNRFKTQQRGVIAAVNPPTSHFSYFGYFLGAAVVAIGASLSYLKYFHPRAPVPGL